MTSVDGIAWTTQTSPENNNWCSVSFGGGLFVAVASNGTQGRIMKSVNGLDWTIDNYTSSHNWSSIAYGNGRFVAVSY